MTRLVRRESLGKACVYDVTTDTHNFYALSQNAQQGILVHNSHQLSTQALDALLKPMEDELIPGGGDKRMVCLFCTTEPERMRKTVFSRCAPAFVIQTVTPEVLAKRLAFICTEKGIPFEENLLKVIASATECHIRDALKVIEGISMLGPINSENVVKYLKLDLNDLYLDVLCNITTNWDAVLVATKKLLERVSPTIVYERLAEYALLAYEVYLKASSPLAYLNYDKVVLLGQKQNINLLRFAQRFSSRPGKPTNSMLICDLGSLHYGGTVVSGPQPIVQIVAAPVVCAGGVDVPISGIDPAPAVVPVPISVPIPVFSGIRKAPDDLLKTVSGIIITSPGAIGRQDNAAQTKVGRGPELDPELFCRLLRGVVTNNGSTG